MTFLVGCLNFVSVLLFECRSESIPDFEGECHDLIKFEGRTNLNSE